jgi:putative tricarboxylic transport membrane protein
VRQSLMLSDNNPMIFLERPISASIVVTTVLVVAFSVISRARKRRRAAQSELNAAVAVVADIVK